jgi:hypothetical protein
LCRPNQVRGFEREVVWQWARWGNAPSSDADLDDVK